MSRAFVKRLKRLLVLVPFVARRGPRGVAVEEAARFVGCKDVQELYDDIDLLRSFELPAGSPLDYLDVEVEDGRLHIHVPHTFHAPPRLTAAETAALVTATRALGDVGGKALGSALRQLRRALPPGAQERAEALARAADLGAPSLPPCGPLLSDAAERHLEVEVDYCARSRGTTRTYTLEPRDVRAHDGHAYLVAWDVAQAAEHLFRLDRISAVRPGTRCFGAHKGPPLERYDAASLYVASGTEREVEIRFSARMAPLVLERWGERAVQHPDGSLTVQVKVAPGNYLASWVLGYGGEAAVVGPPLAREVLAGRVAALRRLYAEPPGG